MHIVFRKTVPTGTGLSNGEFEPATLMLKRCDVDRFTSYSPIDKRALLLKTKVAKFICGNLRRFLENSLTNF